VEFLVTDDSVIVIITGLRVGFAVIANVDDGTVVDEVAAVGTVVVASGIGLLFVDVNSRSTEPAKLSPNPDPSSSYNSVVARCVVVELEDSVLPAVDMTTTAGLLLAVVCRPVHGTAVLLMAGIGTGVTC
jgi:hypothetical protein